MEQEEAFQTLKDNLCDTPILSLPDRAEDFVVYCDVSNQELGPVLLAFKTWRHYLYGTKSVIYTNQKSFQHIFDQKELNMRQRWWIKLFSNYECEIRYHPCRENVVADALCWRERVKPKCVRAMAMTIQSEVKIMILAAQSEAFKEENSIVEMLCGLDQLMKRKEDGGMYFIWVPLIGDVRTLIMDEAYASRLTKSAYHLAMREDYKMGKLARLYIDEIVAWHGDPMSIISNHDGRFTLRFWQTLQKALGMLIGPELAQETTDKVVLIKENLKAARDRQKSYADNRRKLLEFEVKGSSVTESVALERCSAFGKKDMLAS
nr:putative reverse transcriptase domain-containing protein [Tanacetum cinerariifolium]